MRCTWVLSCTLMLVLAAGSASAVSIGEVEVILSDMSSETEEGGTPAGLLDALVTVELSGTDILITVDNNTSGGPGAGNYDISEVWLNLTGETISSVSPAGAGNGANTTGWDLLAPPTTMVDGFGTFTAGFSVHGNVSQNPDLILAGQQNYMLLVGCADGDCSDAMLEDNAMGKAVVAKFINGGDAYGDPNDSAFGASPVPEPGTAALLGLGLIGLVAAGRRTHS
jgi:hypothetical protein